MFLESKSDVPKLFEPVSYFDAALTVAKVRIRHTVAHKVVMIN